jgi:hypothetical protein
MCALLFSRPSRREGARGEIGVARIERSRTQWQKEREEYGDGGNRTLATFHGPAPKVEEHGEFGVTLQFIHWSVFRRTTNLILYGDHMTGRAIGWGAARNCHCIVADGVWGDVIDFDRAGSELFGVLKEAASNFNGFDWKNSVVSYAQILTDIAGWISEPPDGQLSRLLCHCDRRQHQ